MRALSRGQHDSFEANGFLRIPHALDEETVTALRNLCLRLRREDERAAHTGPVSDDSWRDQFDLTFDEQQATCDRARWEATNIVARDEAFLDVIDHRSALPAIADLLGDNIFLMSSRAMIRDRVPMTEREFAEFPLDWHRDLGTSAVEMTEPHPRLSVKVAYWLTGLDAPGQGAMQVVPGSHRLVGPPPHDPEMCRPFGAIEIHRPRVTRCSSSSDSGTRRRRTSRPTRGSVCSTHTDFGGCARTITATSRRN